MRTPHILYVNPTHALYEPRIAIRTPHTLYANPAHTLCKPRIAMRTPKPPKSLRGMADDASRLLEVLHDYGRIFLIQNATENLH